MTSVKCGNCGFVGWASAELCKRCGTEMSRPLAESGAFEENNQFVFAGPDGAYYEEGTVILPYTGIGAVLGPTFAIFFRHFFLIAKIVVVVFAPIEILKYTAVITSRMSIGTAGVTVLLTLFCNALVAPALIYALATAIRTGEAPTLNECYAVGLRRVGSILLCGLISGLIVLLGSVALIVPGLIAAAGYFVVYPVATLNPGNAGDVLSKSWELTKGYKGRILVTGIVLWLLSVAVGAVLGGLIVGVLVAVSSSAMNFWPLQAGTTLVSDILGQITTVLSLVTYFSLLKSKEQRLDIV
jgi:uncharacterized membrane protein